MKKRILAVLVLALPVLVFAAGGYIASRQFKVTNSDTAVPARMAPVRGTFATCVTVIGNKDWRTANTGTVYIGPTSTNDQQPITITSGQLVTLTFAANQEVDLYDWYVDVGTANDGVVVIYSR